MIAVAAAATTADITTTTAIEAFDSPGVLAESVEMLRTIMRTSDKESARLSAARTLANLAARFITRRPQPPRDTDQTDAPRGPLTSTSTTADAPSPAARTESDAIPPITAAPCDAPRNAPTTPPLAEPRTTPSPQPPSDPTSARPRRAARSRRTNAARAPIATLAETTSLARATATAATTSPPPRRFVTAIPPLIDKHYPAPNAALDPLFDILASPIPTDPMTEAELDDLQAIHVNLKRDDLKNPRRAARWRHQLREDRFWKAYWQEWRKNPDEFKRCYEAFMNRKPAPTSASAPAPTPNTNTNTTSHSPSEPLASASGPELPASTPTSAPTPAPIIPSPPHPIITPTPTPAPPNTS